MVVPALTRTDAQDPADAFPALYAAHACALERYATRLLRSRPAAQDVVQEVFLLLWRTRERMQGGEGIRAWLYLSTRTRALNHLRRARRERRFVDEQVAAHPGEPASAPDVDARLAVADMHAAIDRLLAVMPPRQRAVAELRLRGQRSTAEIAGALGMSPRTVELHVARATRLLRTGLPSHVGGGDGGPRHGDAPWRASAETPPAR